MSATAPDGVEAMLIFSVVPRVTDAHPPNITQSVATAITLTVTSPQSPQASKRN